MGIDPMAVLAWPSDIFDAVIDQLQARYSNRPGEITEAQAVPFDVLFAQAKAWPQ